MTLCDFASGRPLRVPKLLDVGRRLVDKHTSLTPNPKRQHRAILQAANQLAESGDPYLIDASRRCRAVATAMQACSINSPCQIVGCHRCGYARLREYTSALATGILQYANSRRGRAVLIGIGCSNWFGDLHSAGARIDNDMPNVCHAIQATSLIDGYWLSLDAIPHPSDRELLSLDAKCIDAVRRHAAAWQLHLHGTLLVRGDSVLKTITELTQQLHLRGIDAKVFSDTIHEQRVELVGNARKHIARGISLATAASWSAYQLKLETGGLLKMDTVRTMQYELLGVQRQYSGGCLTHQSTQEKLFQHTLPLLAHRVACVERTIGDNLDHPRLAQACQRVIDNHRLVLQARRRQLNAKYYAEKRTHNCDENPSQMSLSAERHTRDTLAAVTTLRKDLRYLLLQLIKSLRRDNDLHNAITSKMDDRGRASDESAILHLASLAYDTAYMRSSIARSLYLADVLEAEQSLANSQELRLAAKQRISTLLELDEFWPAWSIEENPRKPQHIEWLRNWLNVAATILLN